MKIRHQSPVRGGRKHLSPCVLKEVERRIRQEAAEYNCSKSFVVATILAAAFNIKMEKYNDY